jgi:transcription elongation factor Elf1
VTPEEVYQYVITHECEFYPDKCKERHFWNCPSCGKEQSGNCAIVKLNHRDGGWECEECYEAELDRKFS